MKSPEDFFLLSEKKRNRLLAYISIREEIEAQKQSYLATLMVAKNAQ